MRVALSKILFIFTAYGCAGQSQPQMSSGAPNCKPSSKESQSRSVKLADPIPQVTFYGDLLPILSSNVDGRVYKCTTCHANYAKPEGLNYVEELDRVIESMENGRMPRPGDPVPADKIELFRIWQLQGFQVGNKNNPKPSSSNSSSASSGSSGSSSSSSSNSSDCN